MKKLAVLILVLAMLTGCGTYEEGRQANTNDPLLEQEGEQQEETGWDDLAQPIDLSDIGLEVGSKPPAFNLETLDGQLFDSKLIEGKKVIINYWATWCTPCRIEMPDMAQLAREYPDDLAVVAINLKEDEEQVAQFVEELGIQHVHILLDRTGELAEAFQILALPTSYFLNSDGTIGHKHIGFMNYDQMKEIYQQLN